MSGTSFLVFLHVFVAFLLVAGLVGRNLLIWQARGDGDIGKSAGPWYGRPGRSSASSSSPDLWWSSILGILVWWAEGLPLWGEGSRWVTVSLVIFSR